MADAPEDGFLGPNKLKNNSQVSLYQENNNGVVTFVQGALFAEKALRGNEFEAAIDFFEENRGAFKMADPAQELTLRRIDVDPQGVAHVRMDQTYQGLPVYGRDMIAHYRPDGTLKAVNGYYEPYIDLDIRTNYSAEQAVQIASADLESFFGKGKADSPVLMIFPWEGQNYLVWKLFVNSDSPPGRWEYFVDAKTGDVVHKGNRIMHDNDIGTGTGTMGDPRNHIDTDYTGSTYQMKDFTRQLNNDPHGHGGEMPAGNYIQTNMAGSSLPGIIATDSDNVWGEDASEQAAVDGHVYTSLMYDYLNNEFDRNGYDDNGASMLCIVNYSGDGNNNAYWDGSRIVIWSWGSGWRSLAACPDVIAHEWGHAVTEYTSGLIYEKEPGALNESFSDMIGAAYEWYYDSLDTPDWLMGENGRLTGEGFRDMENPHNAGDPDTYGTGDPYWIDVINCSPSYLNDYCGVHTNSGVGNKWFFLYSDGGTHNSVTVTGIGVQNAMKVAYQANAFYWNASSTYEQAALGTISAAMDLNPTGSWATSAAEAWDAVNVNTPGPSLAFNYPNGIPETTLPDQSTQFEVVVTGFLGGVPVSGSGMLHYAINGGAYTSVAMTETTPDNYIAELPAGACGDKFDFYVSADETSGGTFYDPDTTDPNVAVVATSVVKVFEDNFETDQGWTVSGNASDGQWDRGIPVGGGDRGDPPTDFDGSGQCYLTDNVDDNSDVDGGTTILTSPTIDLSTGDAQIHYARWFSNSFGASPYNDVMEVFISNNNGASWTLVETVGPTGDDVNGRWVENAFFVSDFVTPTAQMKVKFEASDLGDGSVVEAGVDDFYVSVYECYDSTLQIVTNSLPEWTVDNAYSEQLNAVGGEGVRTWTDLNNDLVGTGLSLSTDGILAGTPTSTGAISFTAHVEDELGEFDEQPLDIVINPHVAINTSALPEWTAGHNYSQQLQADGGTGALTWDDADDGLVGTGLTLDANGQISGSASTAGNINFTARATDEIGDTDERPLVILMNPAVNITTIDVTDWTIGIPYSLQLEAVGGTGTLNWNEQSSNLSTIGLSLNTSGQITGTPSALGPVNFTARATDQVSAYDDQAYSITINPVVEITTTSLPDGDQGMEYTVQLESNGGTDPLTWIDMNGDLAGTGLSLSSEGLLSGTPSAFGDITFSAQVTDLAGSSDQQEYTFFLQQSYICGDANADDLVNVSDAVIIVNFIFASGTPPDPMLSGEVNCDGEVNVSDAVSIINYIFVSGSPAPCECSQVIFLKE